MFKRYLIYLGSPSSLRLWIAAKRRGLPLANKVLQNLEFTLPGHLSALNEGRERVQGFLTKVGAPKQDMDLVVMSVDEAVVNVIEHAYKEDESQPIIMRLNTTADEMVIEVIDQGITPPETLLKSAKTDFSELPDDVYKIDENGRGLTLILTMMDEVEIDLQDNWNIFRMKKFC